MLKPTRLHHAQNFKCPFTPEKQANDKDSRTHTLDEDTDE